MFVLTTMRLANHLWIARCAWVLVFCLTVPMVDGQGPPAGDPFPIQRIVVPPSRLPAELERVRQGTLVQRSREDFEALVRKAARADEERGEARLIKATYAAELVEDSLVGGHSQWSIQHVGKTSAILPLPDINVAIDKVTWASGDEALYGDLAGKKLGLLVARTGVLDLDWNVRGVTQAGDLYFDLRLPPCPVGYLDITIPADHDIIVPKNGLLLAAPVASGQSNKPTWRLQFGGLAQVQFSIRQPAATRGIAPLLLSSLQTRQQTTPGKLLSDFEFQIEVLHTTVRELVFDCDPSLEPYELSAGNADLKDWEFKIEDKQGRVAAGPKEGRAATLVVYLREPFQGTLQGLKIRCFQSRPADKWWVSPFMRLRGARERGETLKLVVGPDVQLEAWNAGSFRLVSSSTESDGSQVLTLADREAAAPRRPGCEFKCFGTEISARQQTWWQVRVNGASLHSEIVYESVRGNLFQLALRLPVPNNLWRVDSVELEPKDALLSYAAVGPLLLVDLQRGLNPRGRIKVSLALTMRPEGQALLAHDVPRLVPQDASIYQATLAVSVDPLYQAVLRSASVPLAPPVALGPWSEQTTGPPEFYFETRDMPVTGVLQLSPRTAPKSAVHDDVWGPGNRAVPVRGVGSDTDGAAPADERCDEAQLETYVEAGAPLLNRLLFQTCHWRRRELLVVLPANTSQVLAAKMDGHWLPPMACAQVPQGLQVRLPAAIDGETHLFEIYYRTPAAWSAWSTWADLQVPAPQLPVSSPCFRHVCALAPGLLPFHQEQFQTMSDQADVEQDWLKLWHAGDPALATVWPVFQDDSLELQRQVLSGAESGLRRKLTRDTTLAEALDRLAHEFLKEQLPLVLDRAALRAADIAPNTQLAGLSAATKRPFWETAALVHVPFPSGPVLTTRRQFEAWSNIYGQDALARRVLDAHVAEAIEQGQDAEGRFVTLAHWLGTEKKNAPSPTGLFLPTGAGWTLWESRPGQFDTAQLVVFETASLRVPGIGLSLLFLVSAWLLGRHASGAWSFRLGVSWCTALGLLWLWLPQAVRAVLWWPLLTTVACVGWGLLHHLLTTGFLRNQAASSARLTKALAGCMLAALVLEHSMSSGRGQDAAPYKVLFVENEAGKQLALLGQDLLAKLHELTHGGATDAETVLLGANYRGTLQGGQAAFIVDFDVHSFVDQGVIYLPLAGIELREGAVLDGKNVFPSVAAGARTGYTVPVVGKGRHHLTLSFLVHPASTGGFQEVRFSCPRLCTNLMEWTIPAPAHDLQLLGGLGAKTIAPSGPDGLQMKANLGREALVILRWRASDVIGEPVEVQAREAYSWDLRGTRRR